MRVDLGLLLLRLGLGGMLATHGWGKVQKIVTGDFTFPDPLGIGEAPSLVLAAGAEFVFSILVMLGLKVRWTAMPPAFAMAVAALLVHAGDPFGKREKALLFVLGFVVLVLIGGGRYGVDTLLPGRSRAGAKRPG